MPLGIERDPTSGAIRFNPFAAGKKQYGLTRSPQATQGPVDKEGYRDREMRKQIRQRAISRWNPFDQTGR